MALWVFIIPCLFQQLKILLPIRKLPLQEFILVFAIITPSSNAIAATTILNIEPGG
ncbi:hypothetical protein ES703_12031 [subsurface metagenome]